ncbi:Chaperone protein HscA [Corynebacterium glaucum]|uniref:Chaperone protein HscA n=1 Tax=Corynebacterium glaucum TaxID=187491 RepID=A0A1Q2HYG6_9CORY|nr:Hsp70 family protein [Corynebacterium glaucum]AQQ15895.1 Chaperone protein HscA [Corynebacterium glaucum]
MAGSWHLAIDFGTSNSAAAHTSPFGGSVEALALSHRSNLMPSAIFVESDGSTVVSGDSALLAGRRDPSRLVLSPKRFIDHDTIQLEGDDVSTQLVFSAVIREIIDRAKSQHGGDEPASVTLTHPERWSHTALGNLVDAAQEAGVTAQNLRTISEPRAAAIHYAAQQRVAAGEHVAVFDFGGGTLDIAVLRAAENGDYRVVAAKGDNSLGGRTIDNLVFRWVIDQIDHDDPDLADSLRKAPASVMNALQENIREAKEMLSDTTSATVTISSPAGERDVLITRDEFTRIIAQPIERAAEMTQAVLREAGVESSDTPIYLTGGSSRIPYVQDELGKVGRVMRLDDPKTVVCRGALVATMQGFTEPVQPGQGSQRAAASGSGVNPFGDGPGTGAGAGTAQGGFSAVAPGAGQFGSSRTGQPAQPDQSNVGQTQPFETQGQSQSYSQGQAPQYGQPAAYGSDSLTQSGGSQYAHSPAGSVPSSAQTTTTKKSNVPLFAGVGVAAVALLAGIGWWALSGNDGDGENDPTQTMAAPTTEADNSTPTTDQATSAAPASTSASDAATPSTPKSGNSYEPMDVLFGDVGYLPAQFREAIRVCKVDPKPVGSDFGKDWLKDKQTPYHSCNAEQALWPENELLAPRLIVGDPAKQARDDLAAFNEPAPEQWANGSPEIYFLNYQFGGLPNAAVYYPDQQLMVVFVGKNGTDENDEKTKVRSGLEKLGFL